MPDPALLGLPEDFEFEGITYKVSPRTFDVEAAFVRWLKKEAVAEIESLREELGEVGYREQMEGFRRDLAAKLFSFSGAISINAQLSEEGLRHMAWLLIERGVVKFGSPRITHEIIDRVAKNKEKAEELVRLVKEAGGPNPKGPSLPTGPSSTTTT